MGNEATIAAWYKDGMDNTLHPLTEDSIVFDVGGYEGNWSANIENKYNCFIQIFEPVKAYFETAKKRFQNNPKVQVNNFGLSTKDEETSIYVNGDGSSTWFYTNKIEAALMMDVKKVITRPVDLISINIEGGEYVLLSEMIKSGVVQKCGRIQVQFHDMGMNSEVLRNDIREKLKATHREVYNYPFVWECWSLKEI